MMVKEMNEFPENPRPWWKYGYVWMFIAGPAAVVVAGFYTFWLAVSIPDPVIDENYYQNGININKTLSAENGKALTPALKGRNHAATPLQHVPEN